MTSPPTPSAKKKGTKLAGQPRRSSRSKTATDWFLENHEKHSRATEALRLLLESLLKQANIAFVSVTGRTKAKSSYLTKAISKKDGKRRYSDPTTQIVDVCGLRVITYFDFATKAVCDLIQSEFVVDHLQSRDKREDLGTDKVGYLSIHYIARLNGARAALAEYRNFAGMPFEIQVRSILQHAWAEIEHDRRFKFPGVLPSEFKRRFSLLAAGLEIFDREFDRLAQDVDAYASLLSVKPDIAPSAPTLLTEQVLSAYMTGIFAPQIAAEIVQPLLEYIGLAMQEISGFGIASLEDLRELVPPDFASRFPGVVKSTTFIGILRDAMLIKDHARYLDGPWMRDWTELDREAAAGLTSAGVRMADLAKYGVVVVESYGDSDEGEEQGYEE